MEIQNAARQEFLDNISQTEYARHWGNSYRKPGFGSHLLAFIVRIIPKIGVLKILAIKAPSATTEDLFLTSMNVSCSRLRELLNRFSSSPSGELTLANRDLDTGEKIRPGSYIRTDKTYAELLEKVAGKKFPQDCATIFWTIIPTRMPRSVPRKTRRSGRRCWPSLPC